MSIETPLDPSAIVAAIPQHISAGLDEETVLLNMDNGVYYGLNTVGSHVWRLVQQPRTIAEIEAALLATYDVEPEQCRRDLQALLARLAQEGLIQVKDERA